jgi:hypothetical protein
MSKTELIRKKSPKLSSEVRRFWGPPQCIGAGSEDAYWRFAAMVLDGFDPVDPIMLVLIKDFVDHSFQINELRGIKSNLLNLERVTKVARVPRKHARELAEYWLSDIGETKLFLESMTTFVAIDKIIADTERRRENALAQIEFYRESLAERLSRNAQAAMIEGEVIEQAVERGADSPAGRSGALERTAVAAPNDAAADASHPGATARIPSSAATAAPPEVKAKSAVPPADVDHAVSVSVADHPAAKSIGDLRPNVRADGEGQTDAAGLKASDRDPG